jgi:hypothetical protein
MFGHIKLTMRTGILALGLPKSIAMNPPRRPTYKIVGGGWHDKVPPDCGAKREEIATADP